MLELRWICSSLFLLIIIENIFGSGIVEIRLLKFINSGGVGSNGHCCDGRGPFCFSDCDHQFKICIDDADGPENIQTCPYFRKDSGEITNSNTVTFGSSIAGVTNPIKIPFETWPGELKLKVEVWDVDDNSHDHVDFLSGVFGLKASRSETNSSVTPFQIKKRTLLTYNVRVYCDEFYYGEHCDVFCNPATDDFGHYTCDVATGSFICDEGWSGPFCDENGINECLNSPCNESQTCIDTRHGYDCVCPDGLTGPNCEQTVNATCTENTCKNNGTCEIVRGHVVCDCPQGFIGLTCEISFDLCSSIECHNNGTCVEKLTNFECVCTPGFSGHLCDQKEELTFSNTTLSTSESVKAVETSNITRATLSVMETGNTTNNVPFIGSTTSADLSTTNPTVSGKTTISTAVPKEKSAETLNEVSTKMSTESTPYKEETTKAILQFQPHLLVRGRVDKNNRDSVGKGIRDLLNELMQIKDQLYLNIKYKVETNHEGSIESKIIIESAFDGDDTINSTLIQHIFDATPTSIIERHITLPVVRAPLEAHSHESDNPHKNSFLHDYWYVVVIIVVIVVCIVIAVVIFILHKYKKLAEPENKENVPGQNPAASHSASSQSFENSLYFEVKTINNKKQNNVNFTTMP